PERAAGLRPVDGTDATALPAHAYLGLVHLDLGDHPTGHGIQPGEVDAGCLADQAATAVTAGEVLGSERRAVGHLDIDAAVVLAESHHFAAPADGHPQVTEHPIRQD